MTKGSEPGSGRPPHSRRGLAAAILVAAAALAGYIWGIADYQREHGRHQIRKEVERIESAIRRGHPASDWLYVEGREGSRVVSADHVRHEATLRDFERLAHLTGLALVNLEVEIRERSALARFRVTGRSTDERPPPARGEFVFERHREAWVLVESRLFDR